MTNEDINVPDSRGPFPDELTVGVDKLVYRILWINSKLFISLHPYLISGVDSKAYSE